MSISYSDRQDQLKAWLEMNNLDTFLVTKPENIQWLTGFVGSFGMYLQTPKQGILITDSRYKGVAQEIAKEASVGFVLYDENFETRFASLQRGNGVVENSLSLARFEKIQKSFESVVWTPQSESIESLRRVKTETEIKTIQEAQAHVDAVLFPFLREALKVGKTESEITYRLKDILQEQGKYGLSFDPIVAFGPNSAIPHHAPNGTKLEDNMCVLVDCGVTHQGYCSDMTRNAYKGIPTDLYQSDYNLLLKTEIDCVTQCVSGTAVSDIDAFCRKQLGELSQYFTHSLGHGVGLEIHEAPGISTRSKEILLENEVVTIEPGIYRDGIHGIRIEDLLVIGNKNPLILSQTPKELLLV